MRLLRVRTESAGVVEVELTGENPLTEEALWKALPFEGRAKKWGEEIYFEVPVKMGEEKARREVEVGEVAYWPEGGCLCFFFGPTPASEDEKPVAYSPVNVIGRVRGDPKVLGKIGVGERVRVERGGTEEEWRERRDSLFSRLREEGRLTPELEEEVVRVYGKRGKHALQAVKEGRGVRRGGRWFVKGETDEYEVVRSMCSCKDYVLNVVTGKAGVDMCYHALAKRICELLR
ncbi:MAG: cyclophilin-like fold protein [Candidatus Hadarchaeales archaeon]